MMEERDIQQDSKLNFTKQNHQLLLKVSIKNHTLKNMLRRFKKYKLLQEKTEVKDQEEDSEVEEV